MEFTEMQAQEAARSAGLAVLLCLRAGPESVGGFAP